MTTEKGYNGWTNYETWNVKLWIDNDEGLQDYWREQTRESWAHPAVNQFIESHRDKAAIALADALKNEFEEQADEILQASHVQASMWADLLGAALTEVNWREIAESMLDDEELTEETEETEA